MIVWYRTSSIIKPIDGSTIVAMIINGKKVQNMYTIFHVGEVHVQDINNEVILIKNNGTEFDLRDSDYWSYVREFNLPSQVDLEDVVWNRIRKDIDDSHERD